MMNVCSLCHCHISCLAIIGCYVSVIIYGVRILQYQKHCKFVLKFLISEIFWRCSLPDLGHENNTS